MESGSLCSHSTFGFKLWLTTLMIFIEIQFMISRFFNLYERLETLKFNDLFKWAHLKLDGIWEFVFSQYFWGQVVIDDGDDFDGCDTFVNSNIIGFQFGRKYATAHAKYPSICGT